MLKLRPVSVFGKTLKYLNDQQNNIDSLPNYALKVSAAKAAWKTKSKPVFGDIRLTLDAICPGPRRCHYCEDSAADEVEHVWPKHFYPEKTFVWQNYLFACGPCNGSHKINQFAVFDATGNRYDLVRANGSPVTPPPSGLPLFIDPIVEDPTQYMALDLQTGLFVPTSAKGSKAYQRAEYTIEILGLNTRDYLSRSRRNAYASYKDALVAYARLKEQGNPTADLMTKQSEIIEKHHPSIWHEIKVTARSGVAHHEVFAQSPELFDI